MADVAHTTIAVLGGAGKEGRGLALRWTNSGHRIVIGSRDPARAQAAADEIKAASGRPAASGATNVDAARVAEIVVLAVPYSAQRTVAGEVAAELNGKILIDVEGPPVSHPGRG